MDRKELEGKKLTDLRVIAESIGIKNAATYKKPELINLIAGGNKDSENKNETEGESKIDADSNVGAKRKRIRIENKFLTVKTKKND